MTALVLGIGHSADSHRHRNLTSENGYDQHCGGGVSNRSVYLECRKENHRHRQGGEDMDFAQTANANGPDDPANRTLRGADPLYALPQGHALRRIGAYISQIRVSGNQGLYIRVYTAVYTVLYIQLYIQCCIYRGKLQVNHTIALHLPALRGGTDKNG